MSYLPVPFDELLKKDKGVAIFSGCIWLIWKFIDKGKYSDIEKYINSNQFIKIDFILNYNVMMIVMRIFLKNLI